MKIIIQCASKKAQEAGRLRDDAGRPVIFVARPEIAPATTSLNYQHPDAATNKAGQTWRDIVIALNETHATDQSGLKRAIDLYDHPVYTELASKLPAEKLYILSAGWGLIRSDFLTPYYDITFSNQAEPWKKRRQSDRFHDFNLLTSDSDDLFAFCTPGYHPLLENLCAAANGDKILFRRNGDSGTITGFQNRYFSTTTRTNWHYECARHFIANC